MATNPWWNPYGQGQGMTGPAIIDPSRIPGYDPTVAGGFATTPSLAGGPPPTTPSGLANGNPNNNGTAQNNNLGSTAGWAEAPEWTRGGGYNFGWDYVGGGRGAGGWVPKNQVYAAGTAVGPEVGWAGSQFKLPVAYNPSQDTAVWEGDGGNTTITRALRQASEMLRSGKVRDWNHALSFAMANIASDYRRGNGMVHGKAATLGFDPNQFVNVQYGEQYDPNRQYLGTPTGSPGTVPPNGQVGPVGVDAGGGSRGGGAGVGNAPASAGGRGRFDPLAIAAAASDQRLGYDMLMQSLTGSNKSGTGPFAGFMEQFFGPLATSLINAQAARTGQMPTNVDDIFGAISSGVGPNASTNLYDYMSRMGREAMAKQLGGGDVSFDEASNAASQYSPLLMHGFNPIAQSQYRRQLGDTLRGMQTASYTDMLGQNHRNYGGDLLGSGFYNNWWNR